MDLSKKLNQIPPEEREKYLKLKYRELKLVYWFDKITDANYSLKTLIRVTLRALIRIFRASSTAFLLLGDKKSPAIFQIESLEEHGKSIGENRAKALLESFVADPKPFIIDNSPPEDLLKESIRNYLLMPMILGSDVIGAYLLFNRRKPFSEIDRHFLECASGQLDNAFIHAKDLSHHDHTVKILTKKTRELEILYDMSISLSFVGNLEQTLEGILTKAVNLVNADRASIMLLDKKTGELMTKIVIGESSRIRLVRLKIGEGIAGMALQRGQPILSTLGSDDPKFVPFDFKGFKAKQITSLICLPMMMDETPLGVINMSMLNRKKSFLPENLDVLGVAGNLASISVQKSHLYDLSIKDELTGLYTFRYFKIRIEEEVTRCRRYRNSCALILWDIDHFKGINDTYGHPFGNFILKKVAEILKNSIRKDIDIPIRYGGEEMALILPQTDEGGALILAERIRQAVEAMEFTKGETTAKITISGGIACFPRHSEKAEILTKMSDDALYQAKTGGRNRVILATPAPKIEES